MVRIAAPLSQDINAELALAIPAELFGVWIVQFLLEQDCTIALKNSVVAGSGYFLNKASSKWDVSQHRRRSRRRYRRSEERLIGKECVCASRARGGQNHKK